MADLSFAQVGEILRLLQRIDGADVTLEWGDLSVHVRRGIAPDAPRPSEDRPAAEAARHAPDPERSSAETVVSAPEAEPSPADDPHRTAQTEVPDHWVAVRAPMVGTFYRAPKPDDPPFASVGDVVAVGDVVGLVEVMKLFTELSSEVAGKVARVEVQNATLVEYDQPLLWIEPS